MDLSLSLFLSLSLYLSLSLFLSLAYDSWAKVRCNASTYNTTARGLLFVLSVHDLFVCLFVCFFFFNFFLII